MLSKWRKSFQKCCLCKLIAKCNQHDRVKYRITEFIRKWKKEINAKTKNSFFPVPFSTCLCYSTWFILPSIYFSSGMVQQSTSYAPFFFLDKSCSYDVIIPNIYWNMLSKLPTDMINIHRKYQVDTCNGRVLFLHHKKKSAAKKGKKKSFPLHLQSTPCPYPWRTLLQAMTPDMGYVYLRN